MQIILLVFYMGCPFEFPIFFGLAGSVDEPLADKPLRHP